jgi:protein-S-isoprenylcysteine O-methyltransferase Ste14
MNKEGIRGIAVQSFLIIVGFAILFAAAGTLNWLNGWIYVALVVICQSISWAVLAMVNPQLLNARGTLARKDTKGFDRVWLVLYPVFTFGNLVVMGFDSVRFHWSYMPLWAAVPGILVFLFAMIFATWAMAANKFFEWTARIQEDRGQQVCTGFPYSMVRHPGYLGLILSHLCYPLILGSWWGFAASGLLSLIIISRTALEDRMLQQELPGYKEYAQKVRYRLLPGVW